MAGPFYFAWVEPSETTFGAEHHVEDEQIVSFSVDHSEGNLPTLSIDIRNPRVGLLNSGRKLWAWLSWFDGASVVPLFFGRLVGVPANIFAEIVTLAFVARPLDYLVQKRALAETLKVAPFYDPIFIDASKRDDPDTILEGYSAHWHVDRTTLAVTISDILVGEDGLETFTEAEVPYDSVAMSLGQMPLASVKVDASVAWTQRVQSEFDPLIFFGVRVWETMSGASLIADWPKIGSSIGGGWTVASSFALDAYRIEKSEMFNTTYEWSNKEKEHADGDPMSTNLSVSVPMLLAPVLGDDDAIVLVEDSTSGALDPETGLNIPLKKKIERLYVPEWVVVTGLWLTYEAKASRAEHIVFTLRADMQPVLTQPESPDSAEDHEIITITGSDVGVAIDDELPIGDLARRSYFPTDRGLRSIEYLISLARAHLRVRARAVKVSWDCRAERAVALSCRKTALLTDHRFPGGQALGKITAYSIKGDGDSGSIIGNVAIECAVGEGSAITALPGIPSYVEEGYVEPGYQFYASTINVIGDGDVGYSTPIDEVLEGELQFPLTKDQVVVREEIHGSLGEQLDAIGSVLGAIIEAAQLNDETNPAPEDVQLAHALGAFSIDGALHDHGIWYDLELKPVDKLEFVHEFDITTFNLVLPKQIDLEAPSSP
jgi:hypothetical protein